MCAYSPEIQTNVKGIENPVLGKTYATEFQKMQSKFLGKTDTLGWYVSLYNSETTLYLLVKDDTDICDNTL